MAFFQNSVINKHLKTQDEKVLKAAYGQFVDYFHNAEIQQNIRDSKEEQFQEGFLRELFVNILGYTLNPHPNYNLTTELKNEKGAKKADGAILTRGHDPLSKPLVLAVIELKGTDTKDLDKINAQAFNYKNNQTGCVYVITSNFEKLRFFIHNSVDHVEFNLFTLTETEFQLLWLCLSAESLFKGTPLKAKEESLLEEEKITKQLYKDYSAFRTALWQNMVKNSPEADRLLLFKKTQKLLDRYLFIFFAEDSGLLPPNSIYRIIKRWELLKQEDAYKPLYEIFNQYFGYINTGRKGQNTVDDIFAYNGGLFLPDEVLDNIILDDEIVYPHVMQLTNYDFQSEVDVNILGHIFENSLNEIENITAELEGQEIDKSKTKRKKDGVFYTPKYITKYIVDNTIGKLCEEKKAELEIVDEEYAKGRRNRKKDVIKHLDEQLKAYRNWLLNITICDPACGSGAFLNQALEFLMEEHAYIDELESQLLGYAFEFPGIENHILEKNIFGVDINEESVEIAKLSLWLRTAQRGRKLTTLNNNIKCGNSLIDDPKVAGEKAFNWQKEFQEVFKEKDKKAFHITTATHDSRTSQRMVDYKVRALRDNGLNPKAQPIWLEPEDEILITNIVAEIVKEDNLNVMAYNICGDHLHLLLVCVEEEVPKIVGKIKAITSKEYNTEKGITTRGHVPLSKEEKKTYNSLWTQKFGCNEIKDEKQLWNTVEYIKNNRIKHDLPPLYSNNGTCPIVEIENELFYCSYEYAFRTEYKGGFDVVIGNPPYVGEKGHSDIFESLKKIPKWNEFYRRRSNTYYFFIKHGIDILKENGFQSLIIPREFTNADWANKVRQDIIENSKIIEIVDFNNLKVFDDAGTTSLILTQKKQKRLDYDFQFKSLSDYNSIQNNLFDKFNFSTKSIKKLISEDYKPWNFNTFEINYSKNIIPLGNVFDIAQGLVTGADKITNKHIISTLIDEKFIGRGIFILALGKDLIIDNNKILLKINDEWIVLNEFDKSFIKPYYKPEHLQKWYVSNTSTFILYVGNNDLTENIKKYLLQFAKVLLNRSTINENKIITLNDFENYSINDIKLNYSSAGAVQKIMRQKKWYLPLYERINVPFDSSKIVVNTKNMDVFTFSNTSLYSSGGGAGGQNFIYIKESCKISVPNVDGFTMYVNAILNSKLLKFFIQNGQFNQLSTSKIADLPIYFPDFKANEVSKNYNEVVNYCKLLIEISIKSNTLFDKFYYYVKSSFSNNIDITKLQYWHELSFTDFIKELNSAIKITKGTPLTKLQEMEWMEVFETKKSEAQILKTQIEKTDKEIDQMVYELYGLSEEEIKIVEGS